MKNTKMQDVVCPFFVNANTVSIQCEGVVPDTLDRMSFPSSRPKTLHMKTFCCGCYENCERYVAIMKKYQEDEE